MTVTQTKELIDRFAEWMAEAEKSEPNDANAMSVATATATGVPSVRMLLLKAFDEKGFVFYTNLASRKGRELADNPVAALCFHWKSLKRQVRVEGRIEPVTDAEADAYFDSRAWTSRIGAWASKQTQPLESRFELERRVAEYTAKFNIGPIPRPDFWSGFRLIPSRMEFWQDQAFRLHDRVAYERDGDGDGWLEQRLFP